MRRNELLRRIHAALEAKRWSRRKACLVAGVSTDFIRNLERYPEISINADKIAKLARALDLPTTHLIEDGGDILTLAERPNDQKYLEIAIRAAEIGSRDEPPERRGTLQAMIVPELYTVMMECAAASDEPMTEERAVRILGKVVQRLVLDRIKREL